jgi:hypothetical protein
VLVLWNLREEYCGLDSRDNDAILLYIKEGIKMNTGIFIDDKESILTQAKSMLNG